MISTSPIYTSAVVFRSPSGEILTARKRGTERFMLIGGKPEPGEYPRATALREIAEEVGIQLSPEDLELVGMWQTAAANESGRDVHGTAFVVKEPLAEMPTPAAEIAELRWLNPSAPLPGNLAPLLETRILPALRGVTQTWDIDHLPQEEIGYPGELRDRLLAAIIAGEKTATSSLASDFGSEGEPLPEVGRIGAVIDSSGHPIGVTETLTVDILPVSKVSEDFARAEGEGFETVAQWRDAHEEFWGRKLSDDELVACEVFRFYPAALE